MAPAIYHHLLRIDRYSQIGRGVLQNCDRVVLNRGPGNSTDFKTTPKMIQAKEEQLLFSIRKLDTLQEEDQTIQF